MGKYLWENVAYWQLIGGGGGLLLRLHFRELDAAAAFGETHEAIHRKHAGHITLARETNGLEAAKDVLSGFHAGSGSLKIARAKSTAQLTANAVIARGAP